MDTDIRNGVVFNYSPRGSPLVKSSGKIIAINGYTTAHKTPIGGIAEYVLIDSRDTIDIAKILNEVPSETIGTVSAYSRTNGQSIMDCGGKVILLSGYINSPTIGTDIEYRTIVTTRNFNVAWIVDKDDAISKTLEVITKRSELLTFANSREKVYFLETLKEIGQNYSQGYPEFSFMNIENIYKTMDKRLIGKNNNEANRYDVINGFKFIKMMIKESYSKKMATQSK